MDYKLIEYHKDVPDEELLQDLLFVYNKTGSNNLTKANYSKHSVKFSASTIEKRFGGWLNALKLCGIEPSKKQTNASYAFYRTSVTNEELIADLRFVSKKLNKQSITTGEYEQYGQYSKCTVLRRFKTWNNALSSAGLTPFEVPSGKRISEHEVIEELAKIWETLGRQPTSNDIKNGIGKYSLHTYERRFGSWRKALEFFVEYMNDEDETKETSPAESNDDNYTISIPTPKILYPSEFAHKTKRYISDRLRFKVLKRDNYKCCICGRAPATTPGLELHVDHISPWAKGGETTIDNLQTLCKDCNLGAGDLDK